MSKMTSTIRSLSTRMRSWLWKSMSISLCMWMIPPRVASFEIPLPHLPPPVTRALASGLTIATLVFSDGDASHADTGYDASSGRLVSCPYQSNCVSSNYLEPPNRYMSPLRLVNDPAIAFQRAVKDLKNVDLVEVRPKEYYIHLSVPGTAPGSLDDIELLFVDGIVNLRCESRVTLPPPPFCLKKNCINGNMDQRRRVEEIGRILGLPSADQERMQSAKWTPIFFNADRVPDFYD